MSAVYVEMGWGAAAPLVCGLPSVADQSPEPTDFPGPVWLVAELGAVVRGTHRAAPLCTGHCVLRGGARLAWHFLPTGGPFLEVDGWGGLEQGCAVANERGPCSLPTCTAISHTWSQPGSKSGLSLTPVSSRQTAERREKHFGVI